MSPPAVAQVIVAIAAPPLDADSICGDLHEEYVRIQVRDGRSRADAWYWSQALRSIPSLLSYSRAPRSAGALLLTAGFVLVALVAMLCVNEFVDDSIAAAYGVAPHAAVWRFFAVGCLDAACFGALIAALRRSYGMQLVLVCACALLVFLAVPILLQFSSRLSGATWMLILAAAFSMCVGGGVCHAIVRRFSTRDI